MSVLELMKLKLVTSSWGKFDRLVYEKMLSEDNVHSYQIKNKWWYVFRFSEALYIHYSIETHKDSISINFKPSYSKDYIDIP